MEPIKEETIRIVEPSKYLNGSFLVYNANEQRAQMLLLIKYVKVKKKEQRVQMNDDGNMLTEKDGDERNIEAMKRRTYPSCGAQQISYRQFFGI